MKNQVKKSRALSGFPEQELVQQELIATIRRSFGLHGYVPLTTRSVEPLSALLSKGGDTDKEIYVLKRIHDPPERPAELGLHFDLTVPFARFVSENRGRLSFPFRRYQVQPAWRGERPQMGRYREFIQADLDIIGAENLHVRHDGEVVRLLAHTMAQLPVPRVRVGVNNRKVLEGAYRSLGVEDVIGTLRAVDKIDKAGRDKVAEMLTAQGLSATQVDGVLSLTEPGAIELSFDHPLFVEGLRELHAVLEACDEVEDVVADLRIARGLDYYTGTVMEGVFPDHPQCSTVCSGGRYDDLAGGAKVKLPGVGASIGVTRIMGYLQNLGLMPERAGSTATVLVVVHSEETRRDSEEVARALRARGVGALVCHKAWGYGKQIRWADNNGIPYVWLPTRDGGVHEVKDIRSGQQAAADPASWSPSEG